MEVEAITKTRYYYSFKEEKRNYPTIDLFSIEAWDVYPTIGEDYVLALYMNSGARHVLKCDDEADARRLEKLVIDEILSFFKDE